MKDTTTGIIGVGLMGHGIAASLQRKGWPIVFLDHPGNQPTDDLVAAGARVAATPAALAAACETIILCVTGSPQVEAVLTGKHGILTAMKPGTVVIDCSTAVPESTRRMAALVEKAGGAMLDAPMTRTPKEAAEGRLNLLVGGDGAVLEAKRPLLEDFAENITHAGACGSGHTLKLLHNFVSLGFASVLGEAAAAAGRAGIDPAVFQAVLAKGGGGGVALDRMSPYILERDPSGLRFTLANAAKDLDYYCAMAHHLGAAAAIARAIRDTYQGTVDSGEASRLVPELIDLLG